jgi:arylsulfatase A-like enzyme
MYLKGSDAGKPETSETTPRKLHVYQLNIVVSIGMMWKLDESVGKVVATLQRRNMLKNTRIVLLSDNGAPTLDVGVWRNWGSNHPLRGVGGMATWF